MARVRAFRALGAALTEIPTSAPLDPLSGTPDNGLAAKVLHRLAGPRDWIGAGAQLLRALADTDPDIIWVDKAVAIKPEHLAAAKALRPRAQLVWFSEDDMFAAHNRTRRFDQGLPLYDQVFTTKSYNARAEELPALGARAVHFVFQAYDASQHHPVVLTAEEQARFGADIAFVGTFEIDRARSMLALAEAGHQVRVWGNGWEHCPFTHANLKIEHRALVSQPGDLTYAKGIAATRINLCFLRKANRDLHTSRSFEIPAIGGFMMGERTAEHSALFEEGREAEFFGDDGELVAKVVHYLADDDRRRAVAAAGHARCVASYDSTRQAEQMLCEVLGRS